MGGGSLPDVKLPAKLAAVIPELAPTDGSVTGDGQWCLTGQGRDYLIYTEHPGSNLNVHLPSELAAYRVHWLNPKTGDLTTGEEVQAGRTLSSPAKTNVLWLERTTLD